MKPKTSGHKVWLIMGHPMAWGAHKECMREEEYVSYSHEDIAGEAEGYLEAIFELIEEEEDIDENLLAALNIFGRMHCLWWWYLQKGRNMNMYGIDYPDTTSDEYLRMKAALSGAATFLWEFFKDLMGTFKPWYKKYGGKD